MALDKRAAIQAIQRILDHSEVPEDWQLAEAAAHDDSTSNLILDWFSQLQPELCASNSDPDIRVTAMRRLFSNRQSPQSRSLSTRLPYPPLQHHKCGFAQGAIAQQLSWLTATDQRLSLAEHKLLHVASLLDQKFDSERGFTPTPDTISREQLPKSEYFTMNRGLRIAVISQFQTQKSLLEDQLTHLQSNEQHSNEEEGVLKIFIEAIEEALKEILQSHITDAIEATESNVVEGITKAPNVDQPSKSFMYHNKLSDEQLAFLREEFKRDQQPNRAAREKIIDRMPASPFKPDLERLRLFFKDEKRRVEQAKAPKAPPKPKAVFTAAQKGYMESLYAHSAYPKLDDAFNNLPSGGQNVTRKAVQLFFQGKRGRDKKDATQAQRSEDSPPTKRRRSSRKIVEDSEDGLDEE